MKLTTMRQIDKLFTVHGSTMFSLEYKQLLYLHIFTRSVLK